VKDHTNFVNFHKILLKFTKIRMDFQLTNFFGEFYMIFSLSDWVEGCILVSLWMKRVYCYVPLCAGRFSVYIKIKFIIKTLDHNIKERFWAFSSCSIVNLMFGCCEFNQGNVLLSSYILATVLEIVGMFVGYSRKFPWKFQLLVVISRYSIPIFYSWLMKVNFCLYYIF
jgi:hypothetical protein